MIMRLYIEELRIILDTICDKNSQIKILIVIYILMTPPNWDFCKNDILSLLTRVLRLIFASLSPRLSFFINITLKPCLSQL